MNPGGADLRGPKAAEHPVRGAAHDPQERPRHRHKDEHGAGHGQRDALTAVQRQRLGDQFAQYDQQVCDEEERNQHAEGVGVGGAVWQALEGVFENGGQRRFADPAEAQAGQRNAKLDGRQEVVEMLMQPQHLAGAKAAGIDHLLDSRIADADQGEFGRHKESVRRHQQDYGEYAHQHVTNHARRL